MFRKADDHNYTASVSPYGVVTIMCDVGEETILSCRFNRSNQTEGEAELIAMGYEEFDPNAHLKAMGMVFINGCYQMPKVGA